MIRFGLYQSCGSWGSVGPVSGLRWCGVVCEFRLVMFGPWSGRVGWCYVCVSCVFRLVMYMAGTGIWRIPAHICTQCSTLLRIVDICFLPCICLGHISQTQTYVCVVGSGFVSTSHAFMRSSGSHPAGPFAGLPQSGKAGPIAGGGWFRHNVHNSLPNCCDSPTTCRLCRGAWTRLLVVPPQHLKMLKSQL